MAKVPGTSNQGAAKANAVEDLAKELFSADCKAKWGDGDDYNWKGAGWEVRDDYWRRAYRALADAERKTPDTLYYRQEVERRVDVMNAWLHGSAIEYRPRTNNNASRWRAMDSGATWRWDAFDYRVMPEKHVFYMVLTEAGQTVGTYEQEAQAKALCASRGWTYIKLEEVEK